MTRYLAALIVAGLACNAGASDADQIIDASGVQGGVIVVLGVDDPKLLMEIGASDAYVVQALDRDAGKVEAARKMIQAKGLYGRVSVNVLHERQLPYVDDLVNLVVIRDAGCEIPSDEFERVLAPRGVAIGDAAVGSIPKPASRMDGGYVAFRKPVPPEIDDWTHFLHGPENNAVSKDVVVGPVGSLKWNCGPLWSRSHEFTSSLNILVSAGGRVFYVVDEGITSITTPDIPERWVLLARDAFNGKQLWRMPLPQWRSRLGRNMALRAVPPTAQRCLVADPAHVYVSSLIGAPIRQLDAATGEVRRTYETTNGTREFVKVGRTMILYREKQADKGRGSVCKLDLDSGNMLWATANETYSGESLGANERYVIYNTKKSLVCVDCDSGDEVWRTEPGKTPGQRKHVTSGQATYILYNDLVLECGSNLIAAREAPTGKVAWQTKTGGTSMRGHDSFVAQGCVWHAAGTGIAGYDLETGKLIRTVDPTDVQSDGHHLRCYRAKATENYLITQYRGVEFVSISGKGNSQTDWTRGACSFGVVPANGLLYVPPNPCFCYPGVKVRGLSAFSARRSVAGSGRAGERLHKGPAFGELRNSQAEASGRSSWPTYRNGPQRHGSTETVVPAKTAKKWKTHLGGCVSPPVMADGHVYVAAKNKHAVYALDAESGTVVWRFTAGGRVDSPPTLYKGTAIFGSTDGHVYCVTADKGELVWKFRAAPEQRLIMSFDQLESAWPVHGSVLIKNDLVYGTAGRSSMLDGGIWLYGLDPATGKVRHETRIDTLEKVRDDFQGTPLIPSYVMDGTHADILVSEGDHIYMGPAMFDLELNRVSAPLAMDKNHATVAMDISREPYVVPDEDLQRDGYQKFREFHRWQEKAWPEMTAQYKARYGGLNLGDLEMGRHLAPTAGFLDDTWFNRTFWMYSDIWPGWYHAHRGAKTGQLLVVGPKQTYALQAYPERNKQSPLFTPGTKGYLLIADANDNEPVLDFKTRGATKGLGFTRMKPPLWHKWLPVRIRGMVETGENLFVAGPPDLVNANDPYASFEGRNGGMLLAINTQDGKIVSEHELDCPPVFDGLIAAHGKLFLSTVDGSVICRGNE